MNAMIVSVNWCC